MDRKQAARTLHNHRNCKKLKKKFAHDKISLRACRLVLIHAHLPFPISVSYEDIIVKIPVGGGGGGG